MKARIVPVFGSLFAFVLLMSLVASGAQVPGLVNYQGRLVNSNGVPLATADYELHFSLWNAATGGTRVWGSQHFDNAPGPGHGAKVPVVQGWFNVILGPVDITGTLLTDAFNATNRYLEIRVGTNSPVLPRQQILSAPYAIKAERAAVADQALNLRGAATKEAMILYVSTTGSDANDGSDLSPKRTIQAAIESVPDSIRHNVEIRIRPGIYREQIRLLGKRAYWPAGSLFIQGMGTNSTEVVINGADQNNNPGSGYGATISQSDVSLGNLTVEKFSSGLGVRHAQLQINNCYLKDNQIGAEISWDSVVSMEGSVIDNANTAGAGIVLETASTLARGGPVLNIVRNCSVAIRASGGSNFTGTNYFNFSNVTTGIVLEPCSCAGN